MKATPKKTHSSSLLALAFALVMGISGSARAADVTLAWAANTESNLAGYKIYYGQTPGGPYNGSGSSDGASPITVPLSTLSNPGSPEFTVHGLPAGTYYFVLTAYNTSGLESGYSNEASVTLTATRYQLSASVAGGSGTISPTSGTYDAGTVVTLTATPASGYRVASWTGTNNNGSTSTTNTVTMSANRSVTVSFEQIPATRYQLSASVASGSGTISPTSGTYDAGTVVTLTATPASGYRVASWTGTNNNGSTSTTNTVTMNSNKAATVSFSALPNAAPSISSLEVNGQSASAIVYTSNRNASVRVVASDDSLVSEYLILDGVSNPAGRTFLPLPGGARQNAIFTVSDFLLNDADGNHTIYAWVKDNQGLLSAGAAKTNVVLDRVGPTVAISFSKTNPVTAGESVLVTANFTDANPISGTPRISINYAGDGSDLSGASMTQVNNKQWTYAAAIPSGNDGIAVVTVSANDAAGNAVAAHSGNTFVVDNASPEVAGFPAIDFSDASVTVTYSESHMKNAALGANYSFDNGLLMSGNGVDISGTGKVFKLPLNPGTLQRYLIYTLKIGSAVTDAAGKPVSPDTVRVNDDDNDGMADDWENKWFGNITAKNGTQDSDGDGLTDRDVYEYARNNPGWGPNRWNLSPLHPDSDGDGIPDRYEILHGLNPVDSSDRDLDLDEDGWSNYEEYLHGTAANDPDSRPKALGAVEVLPLNNAGIPPSQERIPNNTSFAVRIESVNGIDMSDPGAVTFSVDDGSRTYMRRLNDLNGAGAKILRAVPLDADGDVCYGLWVVYYRSNETEIPNSYPHDATVVVTVSAKDRIGETMDPIASRFKIEGQEMEDEAKISVPTMLTIIDPSSPTKKIASVTSGVLEGASIIYDANLKEEIGLEPYFGSPEEIPPLNVGEAVGAALNLLPPAIFPNGVTVIIPCPGYDDVSTLSVYYYDGEGWFPACDTEGNVTPGGEGWMVPGSRVNHNKEDGNMGYIEIQVYHFSATVAGVSTSETTPETAAGSPLPPDSDTLACFISSLWK